MGLCLCHVPEQLLLHYDYVSLDILVSALAWDCPGCVSLLSKRGIPCQEVSALNRYKQGRYTCRLSCRPGQAASGGQYTCEPMMLTHVRNCRSEEIDLGTSELDTNSPHPKDKKIRDRISKAGASSV